MKELHQALAILNATLRELFDESAYARFLARKEKTCSRESYLEFLHELEEKKRTAPKCC
jgi:hypothetical protein